MGSEPQLVIVEDDASFARALGKSFERRGYQVCLCQRIDDLNNLLEAVSPQYAVVDLKLSTGSGLECVKALHAYDPEMKIVVLTGFASIATAVEAIKLAACHYLAKPYRRHRSSFPTSRRRCLNETCQSTDINQES
jgi:two-component system, response regulator RegA